MKATHLLLCFVCLLVAAEFSGCADHLNPGVPPGLVTNRLRVKRITQQLTSSASVSTVSAFSYDVQGRLGSIMAFQIPDSTVAPVELSLYQYDSQNRLTQLQRTVVRRGSNSETYTLGYNGAGQVSNLTHFPSTFSIQPSYTAGNQVSGFNKSIAVAGLNGSGGGTFTFTGNNLTSGTSAFTASRSGGPAIPVYSSSVSTTYTFDNKLNPFYGVFIIPAPGVFGPMPVSGTFGPYYTYYGGIDNVFNLSQNNVQSAAISGGATTAYTYTYNAANLPTNRTTVTPAGITEILRYEYETY